MKIVEKAHFVDYTIIIIGLPFRSMFNSLRYERVPTPMSVMTYVWDKGEPVQCDFISVIYLRKGHVSKYNIYSVTVCDNHACAEGTGVHCCMQHLLCCFRLLFELSYYHHLNFSAIY